MTIDDLTCTVPQPAPSIETIKANMRRVLDEFDDFIVARKAREAMDPAYYHREMFCEWTPTEVRR